MDGMSISEVKSVIDQRTGIFRVERKKVFYKEEYVTKSMKLLKSIADHDTMSVLKIKEEFERNNIQYDVQWIEGRYSCLVYGQDFATNAVYLDDGAFVAHSETSDALGVVNVQNFKGKFVIEDNFNVVSASIFDKNDNQVHKSYINAQPLGAPKIDTFFDEDEYIEKLIDNKREKDLLNISVKGFKLAKETDKQNFQYFESFDQEYYKLIEKGIPKFLPSSMKQKLMNFKVNQDKKKLYKETVKAKQAAEYVYECFDMKDLL